MTILDLVARCLPGETINLQTQEIYPRDIWLRVSRWWRGESRDLLIPLIEVALERWDLSLLERPHLLLREVESYRRTRSFLLRVITGLEALSETYARDQVFVERLQRHLLRLRKLALRTPIVSYNSVAPQRSRGLRELLVPSV